MVTLDNMYQHTPSHTQQPPARDGGYPEAPYTANRHPPTGAHEPPQPDQRVPPWPPSQGYDGHSLGFRWDFPAPPSGGGGFGGPHLGPPHGFDPTVPPPPLGCPPPGLFPPSQVNAYSGTGASAFQTFPYQYGPQAAPYEADAGPKQRDFLGSGSPYGRPLFPPRGKDHDQDRDPGSATRAVDETTLQRSQDQQWVKRFVQTRDIVSRTPEKQSQQQRGVPELRRAVYRAAQLVSRLTRACDTLRNSVDDGGGWAESYEAALDVKRELQDALTALSLSGSVDSWRAQLSRVAKRRARRRRARELLQAEEEQKLQRISDREAAIDTWRMHHIHQVEEKKKEQELKLAADAVLCEVRKKQADMKRMQDVLRSLEKLRRLRKEAASRKGITAERDCDEAFGSRLEQLRGVIKRRTTLYSAEEKALMVMLEGEQEKERRREREHRMKKERERQLQRKKRVDAMLFGEEPPADSVLQPFREYYTQAERSLHALLQIRNEWDAFMVSPDHPDGSAVPQSWILPDPPSDQSWASALHTALSE